MENNNFMGWILAAILILVGLVFLALPIVAVIDYFDPTLIDGDWVLIYSSESGFEHLEMTLSEIVWGLWFSMFFLGISSILTPILTVIFKD